MISKCAARACIMLTSSRLLCFPSRIALTPAFLPCCTQKWSAGVGKSTALMVVKNGWLVGLSGWLINRFRSGTFHQQMQKKFSLWDFLFFCQQWFIGSARRDAMGMVPSIHSQRSPAQSVLHWGHFIQLLSKKGAWCDGLSFGWPMLTASTHTRLFHGDPNECWLQVPESLPRQTCLLVLKMTTNCTSGAKKISQNECTC